MQALNGQPHDLGLLQSQQARASCCEVGMGMLYFSTALPSCQRCCLQVGMLGVILSAIFVIMVGYLMVGISGYLAFPISVQGNVLKSFPIDDPLMQARLCSRCHAPPIS
jgi:hypothetical protein